MATLVLTTVGGAIGGPIGAALGAIVGGAVDRQVFGQKRREGPRLTELAVQTSSYGTPIAHVFGTMRVAGSVVWSTELIEHASTSGGGKRGPSTTSYSYSASFAVLLSGRPVLGVRRIWADGKLLRGAAGDWKSGIGAFRLHRGDEGQAVDPLIASAEGAALTPALRGQAYAVFEELALADFGNRIPSLTFELDADTAPVTAGAIAEEMSGGLLRAGELSLPLAGYAAYGNSLRALVDGLVEAGGGWLAPDGSALTLRAGAGTEAPAPLDDAGATAGEGAGPRGRRTIAPADTAPKRVTVQHHDPDRDYQAGLQYVARPGAGYREERVDLPAVLSAEAAKRLAGDMLARSDVTRERRTLSLDWRGLAVRPGDRVTIAGEGGAWRVSGWVLEAMVLRLDLVRIARGSPIAAAAAPGRVAGAPDRVVGTTILHAFEIAPLDDRLATTPRLTVAAAGTADGWRGAALQLSVDGGVTWQPAGAATVAAVLGAVVVAPGVASSFIEDRRGMIEVDLAAPHMLLADADDAALDAGRNRALIGDEIVQFARAERLGARRWRLTRLWRGRRGSEWAMGTTAPGDRFVLLDPHALATIDLPVPGEAVRVMASGVGDVLPMVAEAVRTGASLVPPSPTALVAALGPDGAVALRWQRRSRAGWGWVDWIDAPLAEEQERYRVTCLCDGGPLTFEVGERAIVLPAAVRAGAAPMIEVRQLGTYGPSRAVTMPLPPLN